MAQRLAQVALLVSIFATVLPASAATGDPDPTFRGESAPECDTTLEPWYQVSSITQYLVSYGQLYQDVNGAIFLVCRGPATVSPPATAQTSELMVVRFDRDGKRDNAWGHSAVVKLGDGSAACTPTTCTLAAALPARDGGFWAIFSSGRVTRLTPAGVVASGSITSIAGNASPQPPPADAIAGVVSVFEHADGGLVVLRRQVTPPTIFGYTQFSLRKIAADGRVVFDKDYPLDSQLSLSLLAWGLKGGALELLVGEGGAPNLRPLQLFSVTAGQPLQLVRGHLMPGGTDIRKLMPNVFMLGDGALVSAVPNGVAKWRADGSPDADFGGAPDSLGYRVAADPLPGFCGSPRLWLNTGGAMSTIFWRTYFSLGRMLNPIGPICDGPFVGVVSADGRADTFLKRTPWPGYPFLVERSGEFITYGSKLRRWEGTGVRPDVTVVEFYNRDLDHYFITAQEDEVAAIEQGRSGPGWQRTGERFGAFGNDSSMHLTEPVCRFYGDAVAGPNSHFFTVQEFECGLLKAAQIATPPGLRAWRFEDIAFRITAPVDGACPVNLSPVYRLYNRGAERGVDPNHRYVIRTALYEAMQAKGWAGEGVRMCATGG